MNYKEINIIDINRRLITLNSIVKESRIDKFISNSYFLGGIKFLIKLFYSLFHSGRKLPLPSEKYSGVLFFGLTNNNKVALMPISDQFGDAAITFYSTKLYPTWREYSYSLPYLFQLMKVIKEATPQERKAIKKYFSLFWATYGTYRLMDEMIKLYNPQIVILANDHGYQQRSLTQIANNSGIKTIYVQHASVTSQFPPLDFSYIFLDGQESLEKYQKAGQPKGKIYLSGGVRFDNIVKDQSVSQTDGNIVIGIATNKVDSIDKVKGICVELMNDMRSSDKNIEIILRPHPTMKSEALIEWCTKNGIGYSDSNKEVSFSFLQKINVLIANQSAIHLDAIVSKTPSILYNMSHDESIRDVYGYIENGLVEEVSSTTEIIKTVEKGKSLLPSETIIKYYYAAYNTPFEYKVSEIITLLIKLLLQNKEQQYNVDIGFEATLQDSFYTVYTYKEKIDA